MEQQKEAQISVNANLLDSLARLCVYKGSQHDAREMTLQEKLEEAIVLYIERAHAEEEFLR